MSKNLSAVLILWLLIKINPAAAQYYKRGEVFPLEKLRMSFSGYQSAFVPDASLVVFMPSLSDSCLYANMLRLSFENYFAQGLALGESLKKPTATGTQPQVQVVLISPEALSPASLYYSHSQDFVTLSDESLALFSMAGISVPDSANADAVLFLIDKMGKIGYRHDHYRARGEQLKNLENEVKKMLRLPTDFIPQTDSLPRPQIGSDAPDFDLGNGELLSDLWKNKPVLLSFYPAAFGGIIPENAPPDSFQTTDCASQLLALASLYLPENKKGKKEKLNAELVVATASSLDLLYLWEMELGTQDLRYANDPQHLAAQAYHSYNPDGYNNRTVFIIDTNGKISHIEWQFQADKDSLRRLRQALHQP